jgi:cell division protein FtsL
VRPARREGAARSSSGRTQAALAHAVHVDPADQPLVLPAPKYLRVAPNSLRALRQRRRARWTVMSLAAISAASMFLLVTFHVFAVQSAFQLDKLERERSDAQRENELLRNLVAKNSSATAIFNAASALGMKRSNSVIQVSVSDPGTGIPKPDPTPVKMPLTDYGARAAAP